MSAPFGLTPTGFNPMRQSDVLSDLSTAMRASFGGNLNLGPASVFGQLNGIYSERLALLWEALEDIYQSQNPQGAEGVSVDNLLALNGLYRLLATPSRTNPNFTIQANGIPLYGLVLTGVPGTLVPAGSLLQTTSSPSLVFSLDSAVLIGAASSSNQVVFYSNTPTFGSYTLTLQATSGAVLTTKPIAFNALAQTSIIYWPTASTSGNFQLAVGPRALVPLPYNVDPAVLQAQITSDPLYANALVTVSSGIYQIVWNTNQMPIISSHVISITFSAPMTTGSYTLSVNGMALSVLNYSAQASDLQAALRALTGYSLVTVTGTAATAFVIVWGQATPGIVTVSANTTNATITATDGDTTNQMTFCVNSIQSTISALYSPVDGNYPFTDVAVLGSANAFSFLFGYYAPLTGQPSTANIPQAQFVLASNTMQASGTGININLIYTQPGSPAQGIGTATCTVSGPNFVAANTLNIIGSPVSGWTSVYNQLNCLVGSSLETDTTAIARFTASRGVLARGSLLAVLNAVSQVTNVTSVIGVQNLTNAAHQVIEFATTPSLGTWAISLGALVTSSVSYSATPAQVQAAINALPGFSQAKVTGLASQSFDIDFGASNGGQAIALLVIANNTTDAVLTASYGQPPKSFQIVAQGGTDAAVAAAILSTAPAGIATYGSNVVKTLGSVTAGSSSITVANTTGIVPGLAVNGFGLQSGLTVVSMINNTILLNAPALGTYANTRISFTHAVSSLDIYNTPNITSFSRPAQVLIYVTVQLVTDLYLVPGNSSSGGNLNAKFRPQSIANIQADIVNIGNNTVIGGLIVAQGTQGLIGAFNEVPGILSYTLLFGRSPGTVFATNLQLQATENALFQQFITIVSFT